MTKVSFSNYSTKAKFLEDLKAGKIDSGVVAFIQETGEFYAHEHLYNALSDSYETKDGDVTKGDSFEVALGKLDKQVKAAISTAGVKSISTKGSLLKALTDVTGAVSIESNDTAFEEALAAKLDASAVGTTVPELDTEGKIKSSYLPSYVDDVLEYDTYSNLPTEGESGKIYVTTDDNKTYRWSGSTYVEIGSSLALGEDSYTAYAGDKGKANRDDIDAILNGDKDLVTPVVDSPVWTIYKNDGSTVVETKNIAQISLAKGFTASFTGKWKWTSVTGYKNPTSTSGNWGTELPASGEATSGTLMTTAVSTNTSYTQTIYAPKKGLMVSNNKVIQASGTDSKSCTASVSFYDQVFCGIISSSDPTGADITADLVKGTTAYMQNSKSKANVSVNATDSSQRLIYAYPASYGNLSSILKDGVESVLASFTKTTLDISNESGASALTYNVYYSGAGAVSSASKFSFS